MGYGYGKYDSDDMMKNRVISGIAGAVIAGVISILPIGYLISKRDHLKIKSDSQIAQITSLTKDIDESRTKGTRLETLLDQYKSEQSLNVAQQGKIYLEQGDKTIAYLGMPDKDKFSIAIGDKQMVPVYYAIKKPPFSIDYNGIQLEVQQVDKEHITYQFRGEKVKSTK